VIFHDGFDGHPGDRAQTVEAVKVVVEVLQRRGYGFTTVDELLGIPGYRQSGDLPGEGRGESTAVDSSLHRRAV
jgi:hypothetical protein